jgi:uncharacterized membrane protein
LYGSIYNRRLPEALMEAIFSTWVQLILRWAHVVAGVIWIGLLLFLALVQVRFLHTLGAGDRGVVEILRSTLWWFRWAALWTLVTGLMLLVLIYYVSNLLAEPVSATDWVRTASALAIGVAAVGIYDLVMKLVRSDVVANALCVLLLGGVYVLFSRWAGMDGAATWIHVGSLMGLAMAVNVWVRLWPVAKKKVIPVLEDGGMPAAETLVPIRRRLTQGVYIAIPLLFLMISNHYPTLYASRLRDLYFAILVAAGFAAAAVLLRKSAGAHLAVPDKVEGRGDAA